MSLSKSDYENQFEYGDEEPWPSQQEMDHDAQFDSYQFLDDENNEQSKSAGAAVSSSVPGKAA